MEMIRTQLKNWSYVLLVVLQVVKQCNTTISLKHHGKTYTESKILPVNYLLHICPDICNVKKDTCIHVHSCNTAHVLH